MFFKSLFDGFSKINCTFASEICVERRLSIVFVLEITKVNTELLILPILVREVRGPEN